MLEALASSRPVPGPSQATPAGPCDPPGHGRRPDLSDLFVLHQSISLHCDRDAVMFPRGVFCEKGACQGCGGGNSRKAVDSNRFCFPTRGGEPVMDVGGEPLDSRFSNRFSCTLPARAPLSDGMRAQTVGSHSWKGNGESTLFA